LQVNSWPTKASSPAAEIFLDLLLRGPYGGSHNPARFFFLLLFRWRFPMRAAVRFLPVLLLVTAARAGEPRPELSKDAQAALGAMDDVERATAFRIIRKFLAEEELTAAEDKFAFRHPIVFRSFLRRRALKLAEKDPQTATLLTLLGVTDKERVGEIKIQFGLLSPVDRRTMVLTAKKLVNGGDLSRVELDYAKGEPLLQDLLAKRETLRERALARARQEAQQAAEQAARQAAEIAEARRIRKEREAAERKAKAAADAPRKAEEKIRRRPLVAAAKLKLIRQLADTGREDLMEKALLRCRQLIEQYPETPAAKEARQLARKLRQDLKKRLDDQ
jgi:hypothetical protein